MRHGARFGVAALLPVLAWGCTAGEAEEIGIQTVEVTRGNLRITAEAVGSIEPVRAVEVKSKASGEIVRLHVEVGDYVLPGALLAEIDPRDVRNRYDQAKADREVAEAQAANITAQLERNEELHAAGVITDQDLESSRLQYTNTQANLIRSRANLELAELQLGDVTIRAPMAGTILRKNVEEGTVIQSASGSVSGGTALFVMASLEEMQVRTLVDETDIGQLTPGLPTTVTVQAHPGRRFEGAVQQIEPQAVVQQNVTKFPVIISLENPEGLLRPGMNGDVEILIDQADGVLLLANTAMVSPQDALPAARALGLDESTLDMTQLAMAARGGRGGGGGGGGGGPGGGGQARGAAHGAEGAQPPAGGHEAGGRRAAPGAHAAEGSEAPAGGHAAGAVQAPAGDHAAAGGRNAAGDHGGGDGQSAAGGRGAGDGQSAPGAHGPAAAGFGGGALGRGDFTARATMARETGAARPTRPMVVFVADAAGRLAPRLIQMGLYDWDRAEVVSGLEEGERVALIGAAQLQAQQQAMMSRMGAGHSPFGNMMPRGGGRAPAGGGGGH